MADGIFCSTRDEANALKRRWHDEGYTSQIVMTSGGFRVYKQSGLKSIPSPLTAINEPESAPSFFGKTRKSPEQKLSEAREAAAIRGIIRTESETLIQKQTREAKERKVARKTTEEERLASMTPAERAVEKAITKKESKKAVKEALKPTPHEQIKEFAKVGVKKIIAPIPTAILSGTQRAATTMMGSMQVKHRYSRFIPSSEGRHPHIDIQTPYLVNQSKIEPMPGSIGKGFGHRGIESTFDENKNITKQGQEVI